MLFSAVSATSQCAHALSRFATTSIPKKTPVAQVVEEQIIETTGSEPASVKEPENASEEALELDSRNIALQALVDKLQDKVEKEITRTLKVCPLARRIWINVDFDIN